MPRSTMRSRSMRVVAADGLDRLEDVRLAGPAVAVLDAAQRVQLDVVLVGGVFAGLVAFVEAVHEAQLAHARPACVLPCSTTSSRIGLVPVVLRRRRSRRKAAPSRPPPRRSRGRPSPSSRPRAACRPRGPRPGSGPARAPGLRSFRSAGVNSSSYRNAQSMPLANTSASARWSRRASEPCPRVVLQLFEPLASHLAQRSRSICCRSSRG